MKTIELINLSTVKDTPLFCKLNEIINAVNDIKAWQATVSSVKTKPSESHERQFGGEKWYCSDCCEHPMRDTTCECNCHRMRARRINDTVVAPSVQVPPVEPLEAKMTMSEVPIMFTLLEKRVEMLEKLVSILQKIELKQDGQKFFLQCPEPPFHYHNGCKCYQNPCVWC